MVSSSPVKRSALGSISSILNTPYKTPTKQGRVGKSATPQKTGIRQKIANLFNRDKENSPRKERLLDEWDGLTGGEVPAGERTVYHLVAMHEDVLLPDASDDLATRQVQEHGRPENSSKDMLFTSNNTNHVEMTPVKPRISPEVRQIAAILRKRLCLAAYKITTQQVHTPFHDLATVPIECTDTAVSLAIQRFRESKKRQDQAKFFRKRRLSTICRRESRRTRHAKLTSPAQLPDQSQPPPPPPPPPMLRRYPSTIMEVSSDQEERGLLSPPDSQNSKTPVHEDGPSTPAPKRKIRRAKKTKTYDEFTGYLGLSSPPQQVYDPQETENSWYIDDVEVGDVPSSVLRGVEGLWALAKYKKCKLS